MATENKEFNIEPSKLSAQPSVVEKTSNKSWSKNVKLGFLSLISFAIPVFFFLQANELKRKELANALDKKTQDSLELRLSNYLDTNIQAAKIKALQAYIAETRNLNNPNLGTRPIIPDEIYDRFSKIDNGISRLINETDNIKNGQKSQFNKNDFPQNLLTSSSLNEIIDPMRRDIRYTDSLLRGFINRDNKIPFRDTSDYFLGQINQFSSRLSDLRRLYLNIDSFSTNRRQAEKINRYLISKTQMTLDTLIHDLKGLYRKGP